MNENKKIFLASPHMSEELYEQYYIKEAFDTNWIAPLGKNVTEFENSLKEISKSNEVAVFSSGTSALHLAIKLAGLEKGDRVFCQSLTFSATVNPIIYEGGKPIFIDSERETWNMSPKALKEAFVKYPDTRIVIVVNLYGISAQLDEIRKICDEHNAVLIEDAAESLGSSYMGKMTGTYGDYGIYSFNGNKIITTSGGGALLFNKGFEASKISKEKAIFWATQSKEKERYYHHKEIGYNYRMSNILAGIGRGQLKVLNDRIDKKRYIYEKYRDGFKDIAHIKMMPIDFANQFCNCWLSCITVSEECDTKPIDIELLLEKYNIECRPIWKPMHMQPIFSNCEYIDNGGVAENLFNRGVCLPSDTKMSDEDINKVIDIIRTLF